MVAGQVEGACVQFEQFGRRIAAVLVAASLCVLQSPLSAAADPAEERARAEFKRGSTAYDLGRFEEARQAYETAYELKPLPGFLYNIGQCYRQLGNYERAIFFYKRFLSLAPAAREVAVARTLIQECESKLAEQQKLKREQAEQLRQQQETERARLALAAASHPAWQPTASSNSRPGAADETIVYRQWWFWTGLGVAAVAVAAAGGTTVYFLTRPQPTPTTLGTLDVR